MKIHQNLVYAETAARDLTLDLYLPANVVDPPLLVWIHGGAWRMGSKDDPPLLYMVDAGYALASISYRLSYEAVFPAQIHDCKAAIRWLRANAQDYGYNAERIGVAGASAGGHLVALLGTSGNSAALEGDVGGNLEQSSAVQAVVDLFGPTNFLQMLDHRSELDHAAADSPESELIGGPIEAHPERVVAADPITYVTPDASPFLLIHGTSDPLVPYPQSEILHAALQQAGVDSTLELIQGAGHGGPEFHDKTRAGMIETFFARNLVVEAR